MTSNERDASAVLTRRARAIRDIWLREREESLAVQMTANDEVLKGWKASENEEEKLSATENSADPHREHSKNRTTKPGYR